MLSLERRVGEVVQIGEDGAMIVLEVRGKFVQLGFDFPSRVRLLRAEIARRENDAAARLQESWERHNGVYRRG